MGEVWKARDTRLDRIVAIKRLKGEYSNRFKREARAIAALNHPHICQLYDVGPDYLVMEYIDGKPLRSPLPAEEAVRLAIQIASALEQAHRKGIIHSDLKPSNIKISADMQRAHLCRWTDWRHCRMGGSVTWLVFIAEAGFAF